MKIDLQLVLSLLKKEWRQQLTSLKKGKSWLLAFLLRIILISAILAVTIIFFGKFLDIYTAIEVGGVVDAGQRAYEVLTICTFAILLFMIISAVSQISKEVFLAEDIKLFTAMPISEPTLFVSKLILIYFKQLFISLITILPINITLFCHTNLGGYFLAITMLLVLFLPLISIAIGSILTVPYRAIKEYLLSHYILNFVVITLIALVGMVLYFYILTGVKDLLLGNELKNFFNSKTMHKIGSLTNWLFPANFIAGFALKWQVAKNGLVILAVIIVSSAISVFMFGKLLKWTMQSSLQDKSTFASKHKQLSPCSSHLKTLIKKEFIHIFRTPSYAFSYFSVMLLMPMMVYFCMTIGSSLITKLIGINCNIEIAIFLTLIFGWLTNMFCSTNISRDGKFFYSIKAMPIDFMSVFASKIILCISVSALSQLTSGIMLAASGYVSVWTALFIFAIGSLFSLAQICFATRYDFNHANFGSDESGEAKESTNSIAVTILIGLVTAFAIGGLILFVRMFTILKGGNSLLFTYLFTAASSIISVIVAYIYLRRSLDKKYYSFSGGGEV